MQARLPPAHRALWSATTVLVAASCALRLTGLGRQSYWTDEAFTVVQCRGSWAMWWRMGAAEVHPPLFSLLARGWIALTSDAPSQVRLLTALIGCLGAPAVWASLRRVALPQTVTPVLVAATATNGMAITYAQDARSYVLLWLAAVGLTAGTLRIVVGTRAPGGPQPAGWGSWLGWTAWAMLATATHLMGLILAGAAALALVAVKPNLRRLGLVVVLLMEAALPQLVWLAQGMLRQDFPQNTGWIPAPTGASLTQLFTTVFAWSGLQISPTGFVWSSWWLLGLMAALALAALGWRVALRPRAAARQNRATGRCLRVLALIAGVTVVVTWLLAQQVHIWTLRGMIVVSPALTWAAVLGVLVLAGRGRALQVFASATLLVLALSLVAVGHTLGTTTYKTDLAGVLDQVRAVRAQRPDALVVLSWRPSREHWVSADRHGSRVDYSWLELHTVIAPEHNFLAAAHPRPGTTLYAWYDEPEPTRPDRVVALIAAAGGPSVCHQVPLVGVVAVRCDLPG